MLKPYRAISQLRKAHFANSIKRTRRCYSTTETSVKQKSCCGSKNKAASALNFSANEPEQQHPIRPASDSSEHKTDHSHPPPVVPTYQRVIDPPSPHQHKCASHKASAAVHPVSATSVAFWTDASVWRRAAANTTRCLVGCSAGDFGMLFFLQSTYPGLGMLPTMAISMASGIATSVGLETVVLRMQEKTTWKKSLEIAVSMSMVSMLTMELAENIVDQSLTGGMVMFNDPAFWLALIPSLIAGFLAPLPYNYYQLKKHGKSCH